MACDAVENDDAEQKQPGSEQAHDHVTGSSDERPSAFIFEHYKCAGGDGVDFRKDVGSKEVVGEDERLDRHHQQIDNREVEVDFFRFHIFKNVLHAAEQGKRHNKGEGRTHQSLQRPDADFIAPRSGKVPHPVDVALSGAYCKDKHGEHQRGDSGIERQANPFGSFRPKHTAGDAAGQIQHNRCKRKILYNGHHISSVCESRIISSSSSVW